MAKKLLVDLFRVVDSQELDWIRNSEWKRFPPRSEQEPAFIVLKYEQYAAAVASDFRSVLRTHEQAWVVRFQVRDEILKDLWFRQDDGMQSDQYWVSDEQHEQFNTKSLAESRRLEGSGGQRKILGKRQIAEALESRGGGLHRRLTIAVLVLLVLGGGSALVSPSPSPAGRS